MKNTIRYLICVGLFTGWSHIGLTQQISQAEYFFDTDPGTGNAVSINIPAFADTIEVNPCIPISGLSAGFHKLFIRVRNTLGQWSMCEGRTYDIIPLSNAVSYTCNHAEYFFDTDPGPGNGTFISIPQATDSLDLTLAIPLAGLSTGFHKLFIRTRDANGKWSMTDGRIIYIFPVLNNQDNQIDRAEFFIDSDPGNGNAMAINIPQATGILETTLSLSLDGISPGFHNLYIRVRNNQGIWSIYEYRCIFIQPQVQVLNDQLDRAEYFIDSDPGQGNATAISVAQITDIIDLTSGISLSGISPGFHKIGIRARSTSGQWSMSEQRNFYFMPLQTISTTQLVGYEYYYDNDPGSGNGTYVAITPADIYQNQVVIPLPTLSIGLHYLHMRAVDASNTWSMISSVTLNVYSPIILGLTTTSPNCNGTCNGSVNLSVTNGTPPLYFNWSNGATTQNLTNACAGYYVVTVTDAVNLTVKDSVWLYGQGSFFINGYYEDVSSGNNGQIYLNLYGGMYPFIFLWSTGSTEPAIWNLAPGDYSVTVTDALGCTSTLTQHLSLVNLMTLSITNDAYYCNGECSGSLTTVVTSGTAPFTYVWSDGSTSQTLYNPCAGDYTVTVTDVNNFTVSSTYHLGHHEVSVGFSTPEVISCSGETSCVNAIIQNGTGPYTYQWSGNETGSSVCNLSPGLLSLTITDAHGCMASHSGSIEVNQLHILTDPYGVCPGQMLHLYLDHPVPYNAYVHWSDGSTSPSIGVYITSGYNYIVSVTVDNLTCTDQLYVPLIADPVVQISLNGETNICPDGSALLSLTSDAINPLFRWRKDGNIISGATGYDLVVTQAGTYIGQVKTPCSWYNSDSITITMIDPLSGNAASDMITDNSPACEGGTLQLNALYIPNVTYQWTDPQNNTFTGQSLSVTPVELTNAGNYQLQVINQGCVSTPMQVFCQVTALPQVELGLPVFINQGQSALLNAWHEGYSYIWSDGQTNSSMLAVDPGTYTVTVSNDCGSATDQIQVVIIQGTLSTSVNASITAICAGESVVLEGSATGGTSFYQYSWSGPQMSDSTGQSVQVSPLSTSVYTLTVYDGLSSQTAEVTISVSQPFNASITGLAASYNFSDPPATLTGSPTGGTFSGAGVSGNTFNPQVAGAGIHEVQYIITLDACSSIAVANTSVIGLASQTIDLPLGWSIFSTYIQPQNPGIQNVLAVVINNVIIVKNGDGEVFWPVYNVNNIGNMPVGAGYLVKMSVATSLVINGTPITPELTNICIPTGWSIVGYLRQSPASLIAMMNPIVANIIIMKDGDGNVYWPFYGVNNIGNMMPGKGYLLDTGSGCSLVYPPN
ncbi:MAG: hypothetical protein NTW49_07645 [Bacteroidia bacterium]|nr:hypothetical protein [Bacteroidia bacterium]